MNANGCEWYSQRALIVVLNPVHFKGSVTPSEIA
jgi:hypothetical protein